ncbi:hypothetical protein HY025_03705 [Candidatus Daviesbacteria bacterium]|nr:hypothetical protein [Candidatus Daviesbacteria bacterium]
MSALLNYRLLAVTALLIAVFAIMASRAFAEGGTVPGWGYGDKNHVHTGPPGQSVFP